MTLSEFYSSEIKNPLYLEDLNHLEKITQNIVQNPHITSAYVLTEKGNVLTDGTESNLLYAQPLTPSVCSITQSSQKTTQITDEYICVLTPIILSENIGFLLIHFSLEEVNLLFQEQIKLTLITILVLTTLLFIIFFITNNSIVKPILRLKCHTTEIANGNLENKIEIIGSDEIKDLSSDVKKMQNNLKQSQKDLVKKQRLSAIGQLASRISHDIRNPLSVLKMDVELLKRQKKLDEKQIRRFNQSINRISHQIDDVLDYVKGSPIQYSKVDLKDLSSQVIDSLPIPSKVKINISGDKIIGFGDNRQLEVLLSNLILNGIQAIENGGTIDVVLSETSTQTIIEVKDSGPGIVLEPIDKVFDPLVTTKLKGTGLGLASVKSIVEEHSGSIFVKNNPTTFTITIPKESRD